MLQRYSFLVLPIWTFVFFFWTFVFFSVKTAEKLKNMAVKCSSAVFFRSYIFPARNFAKVYLWRVVTICSKRKLPTSWLLMSDEVNQKTWLSANLLSVASMSSVVGAVHSVQNIGRPKRKHTLAIHPTSGADCDVANAVTSLSDHIL